MSCRKNKTDRPDRVVNLFELVRPIQGLQESEGSPPISLADKLDVIDVNDLALGLSVIELQHACCLSKVILAQFKWLSAI